LFVCPGGEVDEIDKHCIPLLFSNEQQDGKKYEPESEIHAPQNIGFLKGTQIPKLCNLNFIYLLLIISLIYLFISLFKGLFDLTKNKVQILETLKTYILGCVFEISYDYLFRQLWVLKNCLYV